MSLLASALVLSSSNSLAAWVAEITPDLIAASKSSLPIAALASSIALALSVILVFLLIAVSASFSSWSKAPLRASKLFYSSFLSSSTLSLAF